MHLHAQQPVRIKRKKRTMWIQDSKCYVVQCLKSRHPDAGQLDTQRTTFHTVSRVDLYYILVPSITRLHRHLGLAKFPAWKLLRPFLPCPTKKREKKSLLSFRILFFVGEDCTHSVGLHDQGPLLCIPGSGQGRFRQIRHLIPEASRPYHNCSATSSTINAPY